MTKSSSLDGPVMTLIEEFVTVESIEMEKLPKSLVSNKIPLDVL